MWPPPVLFSSVHFNYSFISFSITQSFHKLLFFYQVSNPAFAVKKSRHLSRLRFFFILFNFLCFHFLATAFVLYFYWKNYMYTYIYKSQTFARGIQSKQKLMHETDMSKTVCLCVEEEEQAQKIEKREVVLLFSLLWFTKQMKMAFNGEKTKCIFCGE